MTELKEPPRLSEGPGELGAALRRARADVGSQARVEALAARLGPLLGPPPGPPGPPSPGAPPTVGAGASAAKLAATGIALIVAGGAAWRLAMHAPAHPAPATPSADMAPSAPAAALEPAASPSAEAAALAPSSDPANSGPSVNPPAPPKGAPHAAAATEAELLEQARSAMKSEPARALARANEHRRQFPHGALVQEREVIAIKALRALGRTSEAEARAEAFAKAFPGSAFERKLRRSP